MDLSTGNCVDTLVKPDQTFFPHVSRFHCIYLHFGKKKCFFVAPSNNTFRAETSRQEIIGRKISLYGNSFFSGSVAKKSKTFFPRKMRENQQLKKLNISRFHFVISRFFPISLIWEVLGCFIYFLKKEKSFFLPFDVHSTVKPGFFFDKITCGNRGREMPFLIWEKEELKNYFAWPWLLFWKWVPVPRGGGGRGLNSSSTATSKKKISHFFVPFPFSIFEGVQWNLDIHTYMHT